MNGSQANVEKLEAEINDPLQYIQMDHVNSQK